MKIVPTSPPPVAARTGTRTPSARLALASLSLCMLMSSLATSIANVALPTLTEHFAVSFQQVQWVVLAYLLAITSLIVSAGRLGDLLGRRRFLLGGILLFTIASGLSGLAPTLGLLIAARAVQGLGAAIMMALSMALVGEAVSKDRSGSAMGLLGATSAVGTALGPTLGGLLIAGFEWPAVFAVHVPLGILTAFLAYRHLPVDRWDRSTKRGGFDYIGTVLLAATLAAYALSMTLGRGQWGPVNGMLLLAALVGGVLFALVETRVAFPLIHLPTLRDPHLSSSLIMTALVTTVMMATLVVGPFYLSIALGLSAVGVGLVLSSGPMAAALASVPAGRIVDHFGTQRITMAGLAGIAAGSVVLTLVPGRFGLSGYVASIVVMTVGYAMFQTANNTAVMAGVRPDQRGVLSGMLNLARNLGLITGASAMGAVFMLASSTTDMATARPEAVTTGLRVTFGVAALLIIAAILVAMAARRLAKQRPATADLVPLPGTS